MKKRTMFLSLLLLSAAVAAPASAERILKPVAAKDLSRFVGTTVYGRAHANIGVVSQVDRKRGLIAVAGKRGDFAVLHTSLLARDGMRMFAPQLSVGQMASISAKRASRPTLVAMAKTPSVIVEEGPYSAPTTPYTVEPYRQ